MGSNVAPRIAYVYLNLVSLAGLDAVIRAQGRATQRPDGPKMDIHVLSDREGIEDGVRFVRLRTIRHPATARWQQRLFKFALLSQVDAFRSYDVVVMRYLPAVDLAPQLLLARSRARIATVHHAKEAEELMATGQNGAGRVRAMFERIQSPRFLERVHGIIGVTDEIRDYQLGKVRAPKPAATVSNGVDVARVAPTGFAPAGAELQIAFVASAYAPWHGVDRLLRGLDAYRGNRPLRVHMVGAASPPTPPPAGGRVTLQYHGTLLGSALDDVLRTCTVGVSSLAMFRTGLRQAAVLKTRDYMARGLPFVYGYEEVDVPADAPYALRVPPSDEPLDIEQVVAFADSVSDRPDLAREMRAFALRELDWSIKLGQLERFAASLA
jgi:glycosyltransferase involved in cell wall biosynthesis